MKNGYYGFIPANVRHSSDLKPNAKLVYAEITACLEEDGVCVKNNIHFSNVLNLHKQTISSYITELRRFRFINITMEYEKDTQKFLKRYITLTPSVLHEGVGGDVQSTYTSNCEGVEADHSLENSTAPSVKDESLLSNNNSINKVYTNRANKNTPVNKEITEKQVGALMEVVIGFYQRQGKRFPKMINKDWREDSKIINGSVNTLYDIIKKDGYEYDQVKNVIEWAIEDVFWSKHLLNLRQLRDKSNNGFSKFQNLHHRYYKN